MTQTILAFGDSNTFGTPPMTSRDFHPRQAVRWPMVVAEKLGCVVLEDGLPGRTACPQVATSPDVHLDGHLGLRMALAMHGPLDRLIIMLGTNDMQFRYGQTAQSVAGGIAGLVRQAKDPLMQATHGGFQITVVCPPPVEEVGTFVPEFLNGAAKSRDLATLLIPLLQAWQVDFFDAAPHVAVSPVDGVHLDAAAQATLGRAIAAHLSAQG